MMMRGPEEKATIPAKETESGVPTSVGFPPVAAADARILILGSLPGQRSLQAGQYYAHPQNAFWKIMRELTGAHGTYEERCRALCAQGIALWDVLAASVRPGSLDSDIAMDTVEVNDFNRFFSEHTGIGLVCFNGQKAARMFQRLVVLDEIVAPRQFATLPSTSPAYAAMPYAQKLVRWRDVVI